MIEVRTPSRLHFGLLAFSRDERRQFGGAGLMVRHPGLTLRASTAAQWSAKGKLADRAMEFAQRFVASALQRGMGDSTAVAIEVVRVPRPHTGLGSGTQLAMAAGRAMAALMNIDIPGSSGAADLADMVGRGRRSGIGVHGFFHGGFIVDGGKRAGNDPQAPTLSPMLMRHAFPESWRIVLIRPRRLEGLAGQREHQAFSVMPDIPAELTSRMCRLVLLELSSALIERDVDAFGEALYELQRTVGECFASAQGGVYADPLLDEIVRFARQDGVRGVGQSSWGPTLYAVTSDQARADDLATRIEQRFGLSQPGEVLVTAADNHGASVVRRTVTSEA